jgi:phosphoribosylaminoimidazolecarboxamide formyltransferase/IMP cyclohydrolase
LHGKELSYNNILDLDSAMNLAREFAGPACVVVKHNNPCGAATAPKLADAFTLAWDGDPLSAFGGIIAFNKSVDADTASAIMDPKAKRFVECIIAPDYEPHALEGLKKWKENVRLLKTGELSGGPQGLDYRRVDGGLLVQTRDVGADNPDNWKVVTKRKPSEAEFHALHFAWFVCKHVKSNAIVLARDTHVVGVGAGQMSRVVSVEIAVKKAGDKAKGSVLASDAFFPFRDNVDAAAAAGITAIIQPGGSMRDADSIAACDEHGIAMLFTGVRHFRH